MKSNTSEVLFEHAFLQGIFSAPAGIQEHQSV